MCRAYLFGAVCLIGLFRFIRLVIDLIAQCGIIHCYQTCLLGACARDVQSTGISIQNYSLLQIEQKQNFSKIFFHPIRLIENKISKILFKRLFLQSKFYSFVFVLNMLIRRVLPTVSRFLSKLPLAMCPDLILWAQGQCANGWRLG